MEIFLGLSSLAVILLVIFVPTPKTPHEKRVWEQDQKTPWY